jgi:hypothetical protein
MLSISELTSIAFGLMIYLAVVRMILAPDEMSLKSIPTWVYLAAVVFGLITALVALAIAALSAL